jgi:hypothetical protein
MLDFMRAHQRPVPSWLRRITAREVQEGPGRWMKRFLSQTLVYPGSGTDASPLRQMEGVAHSFLFLDLSVRLDRIKENIQVGFMDQDGYPTCRLLAWAEFDPEPFLAEGTIHAPQSSADYHEHRFGVWAVLNRLDGGGRVAVMALGAEAMGAISALYPTTPPKGLVIQEHGFYCNPWGSWRGPLTRYADEHWAEPPEWLILGDHSQFDHPHGNYEPLGEDLAVESMHGDWRVVHHLRGE